MTRWGPIPAAVACLLVAAPLAAQVLDRQTLAERLVGCAAAFTDAAQVESDPSRASRLRYAAKNYTGLAMRLGDRPQLAATLDKEKKSLAERRADPGQAAALDAGFDQRDEGCNRLLEQNMSLIDGLRGSK